jgi:hypothetical protein
MRCALCGSTLAYIHGHAACVNNRCPMYGVNQSECCSGETAESSPAMVDRGSPQRPAAAPRPRPKPR